MSDHPPSSVPPARHRHRRRPVMVGVAAGAAAVLVAVATAVALASGGARGEPVARWLPPPPASSAAPAPPATTEPPEAALTVTATGDIIMADAGSDPPLLPPAGGEGFFEGVAEALPSDLVMGNLEQPLTGDTGFRKCEEDATACHAFRAPPDYAAHLAAAGFGLMNLANNHGNDYGPEGRANTRAALDRHGIAHTGNRDEYAVVAAAGLDVAVVGFSPYAWTNDLNDLGQAAAVVSRAADAADLVVVQAHLGAEGTDATRVPDGPETFFGENRGDPRAFARAVIDAGADLVVGHGPHVLRGIEFYQGRLVAYSLGNFAGGGGALSADGILGLGAVLRVSLHPDGAFAGGRLVSTHMYDGGLPRVDPERRGLRQVADLSRQDFPDTGAEFDPDGGIRPP